MTEPPDELLVARVRERLVARGWEPSVAAVAEVLRDERLVLGDAAVLAVLNGVRAELGGFGPLADLLADPSVTDVLVNGPADIWVDRGNGLEQVPIRFSGESAVRRLAQRLAAAAGRRLDESVPHVDVGLTDGVRMHAVLPPVSPDGALISLRTLRRKAFTSSELVAAGTIPAQALPVLTQLIRAKVSFLVTGGTGSGKTTFLSSLLSLVGPDERLVIVEDSRELTPDHPHVVRLVSRLPNVEGGGAIVLRDLVRQSLRMRPDRIIVGEVRGAEVVDLLAAMNTGHDGSAATLHANSARDVPARIAALALAAGLDARGAHAQLAAGIGAILHLRRDRSGRVLESLSILEFADATAVVTVGQANVGGRWVDGPAAGELRERLSGLR